MAVEQHTLGFLLPRALSGVGVLVLFLAGCGSSSATGCVNSDDCEAGSACENGQCVVRSVSDVDVGPGDAGPGDAGPGDAALGDAGLGDAALGDAGPGDSGAECVPGRPCGDGDSCSVGLTTCTGGVEECAITARPDGMLCDMDADDFGACQRQATGFDCDRTGSQTRQVVLHRCAAGVCTPGAPTTEVQECDFDSTGMVCDDERVSGPFCAYSSRSCVEDMQSTITTTSYACDSAGACQATTHRVPHTCPHNETDGNDCNGPPGECAMYRCIDGRCEEFFPFCRSPTPYCCEFGCSANNGPSCLVGIE